LDFVRAAVKDRYGTNGNVSIPPAVLLKMMLLLVMYNVRSERELMATIPERLDWLWFLGYDLDDAVPHHSVLSKARKRWGVDVFEALFTRVVRMAVEAGLVDGKKIFVDASLVEADASKDSVQNINDLHLAEVHAELVKRLEERGQTYEGPYSTVNKTHISATDPDATLVRAQGESDLKYKVHRAVEGETEIITACSVTTGAANEAHELKDLIRKHEDAVGEAVEVAVADTKYGTIENYAQLKQDGIATHLKNLAETKKDTGLFGKEDFPYDSERDAYICPAGHPLEKRSYNPNRKWVEYKASKKACRVCPLREQCTKDKGGRTVHRYPDEELIEAGRNDAQSPQARRDYKTRQHLMERSFATGTRYGYKRARWRGMWRVTIQQLLIATMQNLLKILTHAFPKRISATAAIHAGHNCAWPLILSLWKALRRLIRLLSPEPKALRPFGHASVCIF
jgi:transposase